MYGFELLLIRQQINRTISAVTRASNVYKIANTKKLSSNTAKVNIKKMAKKVAATSIGDCNSFCKTIERIIVATGIAKNNNKVFIRISPI